MRVGLVCGILCAVTLPAYAAADPLVEGARLCTQQFPVQEQANGIPTHLLAAISSTESGRWHKQLGLALPWPWTINVEGKGYYFDSKAEAVAKTAAFIRQGASSIDVGCMQVNLKHHPKAFRNLEEAFDPSRNVAYASQFLRSNFDEMGDWIKATAAYHSRTNKRGQEYLSRIEKSWNRIVAKVQQARQRQGMADAAINNPDFKLASVDPQSTGIERRGMASRPLDSTRNIKVIQVRDQPARSNDVLVVKNPTAMTVAGVQASAQPEMLVKGAADAAHSMPIDSSAASAKNGSKSSTRFIFVD